MVGQCRDPSYVRLPGGRWFIPFMLCKVVIILLLGQSCRLGCKHPQVALGGMSACVFIHVRIQCRIKSLGPFKGMVSTLATHLRGLLVSA